MGSAYVSTAPLHKWELKAKAKNGMEKNKVNFYQHTERESFKEKMLNKERELIGKINRLTKVVNFYKRIIDKVKGLIEPKEKKQEIVKEREVSLTRGKGQEQGWSNRAPLTFFTS